MQKVKQKIKANHAQVVKQTQNNRKTWRERMGVEPTWDSECPTTDLKSAKPTGTYPLP
jgi:hypothetical protein